MTLLFNMSHGGISWCSESYLNQRHSPLCCKHLYKGQVQCLRGLMLVFSPVRRSNGASDQCYLFIALGHTADTVAHLNKLSKGLCVALHQFLSWIYPRVCRPSWEENVLIISFSVLSDELIINKGCRDSLPFYCSFFLFIMCQTEFLMTWWFFKILINLLKIVTWTSREAKRKAKIKWSSVI